jgi:hypothetical protein
LGRGLTVEAARSLLADLRDRGVKVEASSGGKLRYAPRSEIDKPTLVRLRLYKQTLLSILQGIPVEDPPDDDVPPFVHKEIERASELGLVARWSRHFGYISIHDPTTAEWWDLQIKDAPGWAKWEAHKRKELSRDGDAHAYDLTSRDMEEIWEGERQGEEAIVEEYPVEEEN